MKRTRVRWSLTSGEVIGLALGAAVGLGGGCSGPGPAGEDGGGVEDLAGGGEGDMRAAPEGDMRVDPGDVVELTGTWASKLVNAQIFDGPLGEDKVTITTLARVRLEQKDKVVTTTTEVCSVALSPYKNNRTIYPDKAIAAIAADTGTADLSAAAIGATYTPKRRVQLLGWVANGDPATEALPKDPKDARVKDADADGKPGVTLMIDGLIKGSVYVVNRSAIDIAAKITSKDRIAGSSHTEQQQNVLDADNPLLKGMVTTKPDPNAAASTFLLVRTSPATDSCSAIKSAADTIFK
jgi:hypothetical protein